MSNYIWYSGATDITGKALEEDLNLSGTQTKPRSLRAGDIIIGWGTKTKHSTSIGSGVHVLNHPNKIKANRDKLGALKAMKSNEDLVGFIANFTTPDGVIRDLNNRSEAIYLPLIGRTKYHQGGKGFWFCPTKALVQRAIDGGAEYFQNFLDIKNEYRLHVAFGSVIYAVKKVENASESSWVAQRKEKILDYAQKNNTNISGPTMDYILKILFKEAALPDMIIRSNRRGWKFSHVTRNSVATDLKDAAVKSVEVLGLDFGAVDCVIGSNSRPSIIEVNSGPGLQGTALLRYVDAFREKVRELEQPVRQDRDSIHQRPAAAPRHRAAGVGAENAENIPDVSDEAMIHMINAVNSPAEARRVLDLMNRGR